MKDHGHYKLNDKGEPVFEPDLMEWAHWFEENLMNRRVGRTEIGPYTVSTVFLGLDHGWQSQVPILWETMVFGPSEDRLGESLEMDRCGGSREQAQAMHAAIRSPGQYPFAWRDIQSLFDDQIPEIPTESICSIT
jgi:hypothetical protein